MPYTNVGEENSMAVLFAALRIPSGDTGFAGPLVQALVIGGIVFLILLFAVVVFWRARRTKRDGST